MKRFYAVIALIFFLTMATGSVPAALAGVPHSPGCKAYDTKITYWNTAILPYSRTLDQWGLEPVDWHTLVNPTQWTIVVPGAWSPAFIPFDYADHIIQAGNGAYIGFRQRAGIGGEYNYRWFDTNGKLHRCSWTGTFSPGIDGSLTANTTITWSD